MNWDRETPRLLEATLGLEVNPTNLADDGKTSAPLRPDIRTGLAPVQ